MQFEKPTFFIVNIDILLVTSNVIMKYDELIMKINILEKYCIHDVIKLFIFLTLRNIALSFLSLTLQEQRASITQDRLSNITQEKLLPSTDS